MNLAAKLRRGEGPVWGRLKRAAKAAATVHLPVNAVTRPAFGALYRLHVAAREGGVWAARFFWHEPLFRSQCESVGPGLRLEKLPYLGGSGRIVLGRGVTISGQISVGFNTRGAGRPEFVVGDRTFIGHKCGFNVAESVRIGSHCYLAAGCTVVDQDGHPIDAADRRGGLPTPPEGIAPVVIEDDVWLGFGVTVLKGVTIGARSVVAAGSVVTKSVPPDSVAAGNPARVVRHLGPPPAEGT